MDNNKVVILGTAHGINTPGKCSPDKKFREYKFSREVINILKPMLEALGLTVYIDIPQDEVPRPAGSELAKRCRIVNALCEKHGTKNCVYVSIHVNAAGSGGVWRTARGFAVYVARQCSEASRRLAKSLCDTAIAMGLRGNRSIPKEHYWQANFYVIKNTRCPAVLTENLFQDNHEDVEFLMSAEGKAKIVELHLKCIKAYCEV